MDWIFFIIYLLVFCWLVVKIPFFARSGVTVPVRVGLFLLKVGAGIAYGLIMSKSAYYRSIADTWRYHSDSLKETQLLFDHPGQWFTNLFVYHTADGYTKIFSTDNSYWNDLKFNFMVKVLSVFNILSFGSYYTNVIFFSFICFFGWIAIIRVYNNIFPDRKQSIWIAFLFMPSFVFWCSGIHKDGLVFTGLALFFYNVYQLLEKKDSGWKRFAGILLALVLIVPQSNYLILAIVPGTLAWWLSKKFKARSAVWFAVVFGICIALFFLSSKLPRPYNLPQALANKQDEFLKLDARSLMNHDSLQPHFSDYVKQLPRAVNHVFLRPYIWESESILYVLPALELVGIYLILAAFLIYGPTRVRFMPSLSFGILVAFAMLLVLGFTVPILGALVRYRSLYIPFLLIPLMAGTDWRKLLFDLKNKLRLK